MLARYCLLDLETAPLTDVDRWLPTVDADKRLTDPAKIEADLKAKTAAQRDGCSLDPDLCRIVAGGWQIEHSAPHVRLLATEDDERAWLGAVWEWIPARPFVGYGVSWFDLGVLVRRSQLLGVPVPSVIYQQGKFRHPLVIELGDYLTLNGMIEQKKGRGLDYHCQRFGIVVDDPYQGKDVPALWAAGNVEGIQQHLRADLSRIQQVAQRLGVIAASVLEEALPF